MKRVPGSKVLRVVDRWDFLRWFGRSRWVATSYIWLFIVPTAAKFLRFVEDEYEVVATWLSNPVRIDVELPFNWYAFYGAATCFALAQVIYWARCPKIVSEHGDFGAYRAAHGGSLVLRNYIRDVYSELKDDAKEEIRRQVEREDLDGGARDWLRGAVPTGTLPLGCRDRLMFGLSYTVQQINDDRLVSAVYLLVRDHASTLRPLPRRICGIGFLSGASLFVFVLAQGFWFVINLPFK